MIGGYYRFYPGDYLADTSGLSLREHGAYNLLLHNYYAADGKLEFEKPRLFEICHARTPEDFQAVEYILNKFFRVENGHLTNNRADEEIAERKRYFEEQSRKGKLGGRPRKNPRLSKKTKGTKTGVKKPRVNLQPAGTETESGANSENDAQKKSPPCPGPGPGPLKEKEKALDLNRSSVGSGDGANGGGDGSGATPPPAPTPDGSLFTDPDVIALGNAIAAKRRELGIVK